MYNVRGWAFTRDPALLVEGCEELATLTNEVLPAAERLVSVRGLPV
jgi:hypothetical protein